MFVTVEEEVCRNNNGEGKYEAYYRYISSRKQVFYALRESFNNVDEFIHAVIAFFCTAARRKYI